MTIIRQTMLNDYETCPQLCYLRWGKYGDPDPVQTDEIPNKYAGVGTAIHAVAEMWANKAKTNEDWNVIEAHDMLDEELAKIPSELFENEKDIEKFTVSAHNQIDWLWENHFIGIPLDVELPFELEDLIEGLPPIQGTIDRIDGNKILRSIKLYDYKSGKVYTHKECKSNMQATLYALAVQRVYGIMPESFTFIFSKHGKLREIPITDEFLEKGLARIRNNWYHIVNEDFTPHKKRNKYFCKHFCDVNSKCKFYYKPPKGWEGVERW